MLYQTRGEQIIKDGSVAILGKSVVILDNSVAMLDETCVPVLVLLTQYWHISFTVKLTQPIIHSELTQPLRPTISSTMNWPSLRTKFWIRQSFTHQSLLITHYSLLTSHYSRLYSPLTSHYSSLTIHYSPVTTQDSIHHSLLTTYHSLTAQSHSHSLSNHTLTHSPRRTEHGPARWSTVQAQCYFSTSSALTLY